MDPGTPQPHSGSDLRIRSFEASNRSFKCVICFEHEEFYASNRIASQ